MPFAPAEFSNMKGSASDKNRVPNRTDDSWIGLLKANGIPIDFCATDGEFYSADNNEPLKELYDEENKKLLKTFSCDNSRIDGGHVCIGKRNQDRADHVYLFPICHHHNVYSAYKGAGCGCGFYMKPGGKVTDALELLDYLKNSMVEEAMAENKSDHRLLHGSDSG